MKPTTIILACLLCLTSNLQGKASDSLSVRSDSTFVKTEQFDPVVATQQYLAQLTPEQKEKSDSYFEGGYWLILWGIIIDIIIAWIFLSLGLSKWIKKIATKAKRVNIQNLIYIGLYFLLIFLLTFPMSVYTGFIREHQYDLSNLTLGGWLGEELKSLLLSLLLGTPIFMLLYITIRKVKERWWAWASGVGFLFLVFGMIIYPVLIALIFNTYKPLEESPLKNEILSIARANGVPADNVYQFDASKQSKRVSANVSGFGSTIRISLNDNLLNRCTTAEIKAVMAHEIGHYVLNHIYKGIVFAGLFLCLAFAIISWLFNITVKKWGSKWGIISVSDIGGLPLFMLLFSLFFTITSPIQKNITRVQEIEADYFGYNAAREPDAFATIALKLSEYRKIEPGHLEEILFFDHPSGKTRIMNAMIWKAENLESKP